MFRVYDYCWFIDHSVPKRFDPTKQSYSHDWDKLKEGDIVEIDYLSTALPADFRVKSVGSHALDNAKVVVVVEWIEDLPDPHDLPF